MASLPLVMTVLLAWGALYGTTVCNLTCGPILALRLGDRARGWRDGAILALGYSLPRIAVLMIFGAIVGGAGGFASEMIDKGIITAVQAMAYLAIGAIMVLSGFRHSKGEDACRGNGVLDRMVMLFVSRGGRAERAHFALLGAIFSLACLGEAWVVLTASTVGTSLDGRTPLTGALFGMAGTTSFGIGLTLPVLVISAFSSEMGKRHDLEGYLRSGGKVLMVIGALLMLFETVNLIGLIT